LGKIGSTPGAFAFKRTPSTQSPEFQWLLYNEISICIKNDPLSLNLFRPLHKRHMLPKVRSCLDIRDSDELFSVAKNRLILKKIITTIETAKFGHEI